MGEDFDGLAAGWDDDPVRGERAARVAERIRQQVPLDGSMQVLEFGAGTGLLGFHLLSHVGRLTFADTSRSMLDEVERKLAAGGIDNADTLHIDEQGTAIAADYDAIVSLMVLHHVRDPHAIVHRLVGRLKPGGHLIVCDLDQEDGSFHGPGADVHRGFPRAEMAALLRACGLVDIVFSTPYIMRKQPRAAARDADDRPRGRENDPADGAGLREYPLFLASGRNPWPA
ncbi:MAG: class I SAM-dependent methyltransferase [Candidatus Krumholzibacteriia bacterium]